MESCCDCVESASERFLFKPQLGSKKQPLRKLVATLSVVGNPVSVGLTQKFSRRSFRAFSYYSCRSVRIMLLRRQQRQLEDSYLGQLEQMLVGRLRRRDDGAPLRSRTSLRRSSELSRFSLDINEELCRLEQMIEDFVW